MEDTINGIIFPAPEPTYSFSQQYSDGRLVHIRRRDSSHSFTVGYYYSRTLMDPSLSGDLHENVMLPAENVNSGSTQETDRLLKTQDGLASRKSVPLLWPDVSLVDDYSQSGKPPPSHLVIYAHPNACDIDMMSEELSYIGLQYCNVDVLAWEFRGYGMCKEYGDPSEKELYLDMEGVYTFATEELKIPPSRIILIGRSIGSGPVVQLAAHLGQHLHDQLDIDGNPEQLAGVLLQCPFTSISDSVNSIISNRTSSFSFGGGLAAKVSQSIAKKVIVDRFRSIDVISRLFGFRGVRDTADTSPLCASVKRLVIHHGELDDIVPISHSRNLIEMIRNSVVQSLIQSSVGNNTTPSKDEIDATMDSLTHLEVEKNYGHNDLSTIVLAELIDDHFIKPFMSKKRTMTVDDNPLITAVKKYLPRYIMGNSFYHQVYKKKLIKTPYTREMTQKCNDSEVKEPSVDDASKDSNAPYDGQNRNEVKGMVEFGDYKLSSQYMEVKPRHKKRLQSNTSHLNFGQWTSRVLPRELNDFGRILQTIAATPDDTPLSYRAQRGLVKILVSSMCCFAQHVAIGWLRTQRKRAILEKELKTRGPKNTTTKSLKGDLQVSGSFSPVENPRTMPPLISVEEFILEQIALHGSPLGIYLLPVIRGRDSDQIAGMPQRKPNADNGEKDENNDLNDTAYDYLHNTNHTSTGCHALIFGSFVADPSSTGRTFKSRDLCDNMAAPESGVNLVNKDTTYECCYTSCVGLSPSRPIDSLTNDVNLKSEITNSAKKMKWLPERLPKVPLLELEISANLLHVVKNFVGSLSNADLGGVGNSLSDFELDDLSGTVAIDKSLFMMTEQQVDIIQSECERLLIAMQQLEAGVHLGSFTPVMGSFTGPESPLVRGLRPALRLLCGDYQQQSSSSFTHGEVKDAGDGDSSREDIVYRDGYIVSDLYLPSSYSRESGVVVPTPLLVRLSKIFSYDFFNTVGDLSSVYVDVQERARRIKKSISPRDTATDTKDSDKAQADKEGNTAVKGEYDNSFSTLLSDTFERSQSMDTYTTLIFDLQSALLRNVPEGLVGAVGCGKFPDGDAAVALLSILYYERAIPSALFFNENKIRRREGNSVIVEDNTYMSYSDGGYGGTYIPALVGGSSSKSNSKIDSNRGKSTYSPDEGKLHWIKPDVNVSAGNPDNRDCVIS